MKQLVGLIQIRMGSSRVPGKGMALLAGKPLVWHILDRLRRVEGLNGIILATTEDPQNDVLIDFAEREGLEIFRWEEEDDIVGRLAGAARMTEADAILKVNADCPLVDPAIMEDIIDLYFQNQGADFISNKVRPSYPLGFSVELISRQALMWCDSNLSEPVDRELVVKWIMDHPKQFKVVSMEGERDLKHLNLTLDTPEDFQLIEEIFGSLFRPGEAFGLDEVLGFLESVGLHESAKVVTGKR